MNELTDNPRQLILDALEDFETVEASSNYVIDLGEWYAIECDENDEEKCFVCLAGSMIACSLGFGHEEVTFTLGNLNEYDQVKMGFIDHFRRFVEQEHLIQYEYFPDTWKDKIEEAAEQYLPDEEFDWKSYALNNARYDTVRAPYNTANKLVTEFTNGMYQ